MRVILQSLVLVFSLTWLASAQMTVSGTAIDVIDGKTVLIELPNGKIRAELQYIEVPERGQELHETVVKHLRGLVAGRSVSFRAQQIATDRSVGLLMIGEVDIAQQMLRDGAAWHIRHRPTGQADSDAKTYESNEADAKSEKRGVWSIEGMKTAWQFRADRDAAATTPVPALTKEMPVERPQVKKPTGYWGDVNPKMQNVGALANGYNHAARSGYVGTSYLPAKATDEEAAAGTKAVIDITYFYKEYEVTGRYGVFVFTLVSSASNWRFLEKNELTVISDGKKFPVGKPKRIAEEVDGKQLERLSFNVDRKTLDAFVNGSEVILTVGKSAYIPAPGMQMLLNNLLSATK
ncbi:MAG TPA: thermonuclease family protein [Pyrinomonadaceae bacterium]|nr:thermonuclease family protein [Pyrinomonadaceae bacterium]